MHLFYFAVGFLTCALIFCLGTRRPRKEPETGTAHPPICKHCGYANPLPEPTDENNSRFKKTFPCTSSVLDAYAKMTPTERQRGLTQLETQAIIEEAKRLHRQDQPEQGTPL